MLQPFMKKKHFAHFQRAAWTLNIRQLLRKEKVRKRDTEAGHGTDTHSTPTLWTRGSQSYAQSPSSVSLFKYTDVYIYISRSNGLCLLRGGLGVILKCAPSRPQGNRHGLTARMKHRVAVVGDCNKVCAAIRFNSRPIPCHIKH